MTERIPAVSATWVEHRFLAEDGRVADVALTDLAARVSILPAVPGGGERLAADAAIAWSAMKGPSAEHAYLALLPVPRDKLEEFDAWFIEEHGPMVFQAAQWATAMLCAVRQGPYTRIGVHLLADLAALDSPERQAAGVTPWTKQIMSADWSAGIVRFVGSRHEPDR